MQSEFWGNQENPDRYNGACQRPEDHPHGSKWVWLTLNPNSDGGLEAVERLDKKLTVRIWGDDAVNNVRLVIWVPEGMNYICKNAVSNEWLAPEKIISSAVHLPYPKVYNTEGGFDNSE